nr:DUF748 domain-containing protein [Rhodohalobacter sp. SW132]
MAGLFGDTNDDADEDLKIRSITIENTNINIYRGGESEAHTTVDSLNLQLSSLDLSAETHQLNQLIGSAEISARKIVHRLSDGHYRVEAENPHFDLNPGNFTVNSFAVIPEYSPHELPERLGHETDHFDIRADNIQLRGFRAAEWLDSNELIADVLDVENLILDISRDKNFPDKPRTVDPLLNVQFADFPFAVSLDSINWKGGMILYREMEEGQDSFGEIRFEDVDIEFAGIQNRNPEQTIQASARSEFLGISTLTVDFEFFLANNGRQNIRGKLEQIDLKELNPVLEPLAFVRIDDGQLSSLEFEFTADDEKSTGEIEAIYQDLSIKILDEETLEESTSDNIMSFVANLVAIRSSNDGDEPRIGEIDFDREEDRSMFNYWWKSLRDGIKSTVQRF